ncbi:MAG TPA: AMP-binding protein, partial [Actinomycetota bacterium]|nr:AMP-binding protein [Actinomycetota bacterium]
MSGDVIRVREEIDKAIEGKTVLEFFERNTALFGDRPALRRQTESGWETVTWREYGERAVEIGAGLRALGVKHGDFVAIMARNVPEHVIADAGALHAAATPVSIYNTLAPEQIAYIAKDCKAKVAVLENREFAKRWAEIKDQLPALTAVVLIDDAEDFRYLGNVLSWDELIAKGRDALSKTPDLVKDAIAEITPDDPATIVYTSGTTGPPKGVEITHRNVR